VADDIVAQIASGNWRVGDRLPSERALCERYQVSQITVRRALRELAHIGRVYSHHGLGWFVSPDSAPTSRSYDVTLVLPDLDWLTAPLVRALNDALSPSAVVLRLLFTGGEAEAEAKAVKEAIACEASALLLAVTGQERQLAQHYARLVAGVDLPVLLLLRDVTNLSLPCVVLDEQSCMEQLTRHLLGLGHQRVAYAGADPALIEGQRRYRGFASTLWEHGLELPLDWVFSGELTGQAMRARFRRAFQDPDRPTAIVCASDMQAAESMSLLRDLDLQCPEDVAIVGLGDRDFAPLLPTPLTTFRPDLQGLGRAAAEMTLDLLAGRSVRNVLVSGQLITRRSCGAGSATEA
jgi:DNA-binding LacI/PurR family transcriptional regulator